MLKSFEPEKTADCHNDTQFRAEKWVNLHIQLIFRWYEASYSNLKMRN